MHQYQFLSTQDQDELRTVIYKLVIISILIGFLIAPILANSDGLGLNLPVLAPPSTLVIFLTLYQLTDKILWKTRFKSIIGISVPNLNGEWIGEGHITKPDGTTLNRPCIKLQIEQSWRNISICLIGEQHSSYSFSATCIARANRFDLHYIFTSEKEAASELTHRGCSCIRISAKKGQPSLNTLKMMSFTEQQTLNKFKFIQSLPNES